jgi:hypothetical protein
MECSPPTARMVRNSEPHIGVCMHACMVNRNTRIYGMKIGFHCTCCRCPCLCFTIVHHPGQHACASLMRKWHSGQHKSPGKTTGRVDETHNTRTHARTHGRTHAGEGVATSAGGCAPSPRSHHTSPVSQSVICRRYLFDTHARPS